MPSNGRYFPWIGTPPIAVQGVLGRMGVFQSIGVCLEGRGGPTLRRSPRHSRMHFTALEANGSDPYAKLHKKGKC